MPVDGYEAGSDVLWRRGQIYWVKLDADIPRNTCVKFQVNTFTFIEVMTVFVKLGRVS